MCLVSTTEALQLPAGMWLTKLNDLETVAMPTLATKVSKCSLVYPFRIWKCRRCTATTVHNTNSCVQYTDIYACTNLLMYAFMY